jgi:hypothetical protein
MLQILALSFITAARRDDTVAHSERHRVRTTPMPATDERRIPNPGARR